MNPIKEIRMEKDLSLAKFAELVDSNSNTIMRVEKGECLETTYLTIIKKLSLNFEEINEGELIKKYKEWKKEENK